MSKVPCSYLKHHLLKRRLHYEPETGVWTWLDPLPRSGMSPGDRAGRLMDNGRWQMTLYGERHYSARLAWFYMTGEWPKDQIDHINRDVTDDRWCNLREATQSQNSFNREWCEQNGDMRGIREHGNKYKVDIGGWYLGLYEYLDIAMAIRDLALIYKGRQFATLPQGATS